jgi:hypothetical protein
VRELILEDEPRLNVPNIGFSAVQPGPRRLHTNLAFVALGLLLAIWLAWFPPSPDLAAQVYRVHLFSVDGFSLWDNNWYGGHYLPDYSLLFPPLAALLSLRGAGACAVALSTVVFGRLAARQFGSRAPIATGLFAVGAAGDLFIGRVTFALGVALGLSSVLAVVNRRRWLAALLSLGCAAASPVAGLFLVLAAGADLLTHRSAARVVALAVPAVGLTLTLTLLFPEGGYEGFSLLSLLPAVGTSLALLLLLPARERLLRRASGLYALALLLAFVLPSPMGSNAVRLGVLLAPAILAGAVGVEDVAQTLSRVAGWWPTRWIARHRWFKAERPGLPRLVLAVVGVAMVLWQINGPVVQSFQASVDPSTRLSYYTPVLSFLDKQRHGGPMRIEVAFTSSHWDATVLGGSFALARGWERQLDTKYDGIFYGPPLTAGVYHAWLLDTAVRFVVLSDAPLDSSSLSEAALIRAGLPYLHLVFSSAHWRVYAVLRPRPLLSGPGRLLAMDGDGFTIRAVHAGVFLVRVRYTPYWAVNSKQAAVSEAPNGWTFVTVEHPGQFDVDAQFSLSV